MFLRLFPLQSTVLYPGMPLPLTVFEPRYLQLMQECQESEEPFGVLLLREGREVGPNETDPFTVGTTADIQAIAPTAGRLSVQSVGGERFRVREFIHEHPYLAAEVDIIEEMDPSLVDASLVADVKEGALDLVRTLMSMRGGLAQGIAFPDDPIELSFHVAQLFQGNPGVQQQLLEQDTEGRLRDEASLLKTVKGQLSDRGSRRNPGERFSQN